MLYHRAREWLGAEAARDYWSATEHAVRRLGDLAGDALRHTGSMQVAADGEEREELWSEYQALREDGLAADWREPLPPPLDQHFPAGIFHPAPDAAAQPARMTRRLAEHAVEAGVEFVENHRVESLGELEATRILVATDGYPSGLLGDFGSLIVPTRGQMILTDPVERLFDCPHYGRHGFRYWQQLEDGRIAAGGFRDADMASEFTTDEVTTPTIQRALDDFIEGLVGRPIEVTHRWAGIFGLVLDFLPVVGPVPGQAGTWVCGGYSGHGNVLGFLCGDLVAKAMLGDESPLLALFEPQRLLTAA
jgi:gamma-glutamylputrescine oxidase